MHFEFALNSHDVTDFEPAEKPQPEQISNITQLRNVASEKGFAICSAWLFLELLASLYFSGATELCKNMVLTNGCLMNQLYDGSVLKPHCIVTRLTLCMLVLIRLTSGRSKVISSILYYSFVLELIFFTYVLCNIWQQIDSPFTEKAWI